MDNKFCNYIGSGGDPWFCNAPPLRDAFPDDEKFAARLSLRRLETQLRRDCETRISALIAAAADPVRARTLRDIAAGLASTGLPAISFEAEPVLPLIPAAAHNAFHEFLIRLRGENGAPVTPAELFGALDHPDSGKDAAKSFRLWLIVAQIDEFCGMSGPRRASINIAPAVMNDPAFHALLRETLERARQAHVGPLVFEATEEEPWTQAAIAALKDIARDFGVTIAIDDYGAPQGYNDHDTLAAFAAAWPMDKFVVKIDGPVIRDFLGNRNEDLIGRLREIKEICPGAAVVAERVYNAAEAHELRARLHPHSLGNMITLIQSRELKTETPASFLGKMYPSDECPAGPAL